MVETAVTSQPLTHIRWITSLVSVALCIALVQLVLSSPTFPASTLHALALLAIAVVTYGWLILPLAGGITLSVVLMLCLVWSWAARPSLAFGMDFAAFVTVLSLAALWHKRSARRLQQMSQTLEDLREEQTVKDQAITLASQAREALQKKLSRYTQLQAVAEELSNMTDLTAIAQLAVERTFALIGKSDVCLLFLVDKERQELSLFASKKRDSVPVIRAKQGDQFDRYVLRTHRPLLVNDVRRDFRFTVSMTQERSVNSVIACPLLMGQVPEGVLRLDSADAGVYSQDDLRFLDILLDLISTAMTNARLFAQTQRLAMTDGLTGLTLRRPFLDQLTRELARAGRSREPVSVLMLDVDHFKDYNDAFGHTAGDVLLQSVAEILRTVIPPGGVSARYGGEEFAILLPRWPRHQASEIAETIRRLVQQNVPSHVGATAGATSGVESRATRAGASVSPGMVTISIGVATFPEDAQAELELIRVADQRLYQAKHAGRNLVCSA